VSFARPALRLAPAFAICAVLGAAATVGAQSPVTAERPRVLVLTSGVVYGGLVTEYSYGLKVRGTNGSVVLPADRVQANAATLDGAFLQMRSRVPAEDGSGRAKLAAWALSHGLPLRSREELLAALELEPDRDDWRRALRRVETVLAKNGSRPGMGGGSTGTRPAGAVTPASHTEPGRTVVPAAASATGLSNETMRSYTGQVERVLLTRCGNAACHGGPGAGAFHLTNPSRSAITTRKNLAATLAFVASDGGRGPALLTTCVDRPDRRGRTPFRVQGGAASRALLAAWVTRVVAERPDLAAARPEKPILSPAETLSESGGAAPPARPIQPDAFDPAEFNRTFAPPPSSSADLPK